jgi:hypothetical protein
MEFDAVCRLVIASEQPDARRLLRKVAVNPVLLEASRPIEQVVLLITTLMESRQL